MNLIVESPDTALWQGRRLRCAIGRAGTIASDAKREGDGATPIGIWPVRRILFRPDRLAAPATALPVQPLRPDDACCDVSGDPMYNRQVRLPYPTSDERLWRDDGVYDVIAVLGYNDDPVRDGCGSAIFLHVARPDLTPTAGCVALTLPDLIAVLAEAGPSMAVEVR